MCFPADIFGSQEVRLEGKSLDSLAFTAPDNYFSLYSCGSIIEPSGSERQPPIHGIQVPWTTGTIAFDRADLWVFKAKNSAVMASQTQSPSIA